MCFENIIRENSLGGKGDSKLSEVLSCVIWVYSVWIIENVKCSVKIYNIIKTRV